MKTLITAAGLAAALTLSACGGNGDDALGDRAADQAEAKADTIEDAGEAREDVIDDADVNAEAMTPNQQDALVNGAMPVEAAPKR